MARRRGERGTTIIEVMIAAALLLIAMVGFLGTLNTAARSTGVGHRRTTAAFLRQAVVDRVTVTPRDRLSTYPASTWLVDACYDVNSQLLPGGSNTGYSATFACPTGTMYRTWLYVVPDMTNRRWQVNVYAERTDGGCSSADRYRSIDCVAADLLLTD
jgi:Tfp pilus assembly protein PilV